MHYDTDHVRKYLHSLALSQVSKIIFELPVFTRSTCGNIIPSKGRQGKVAFSFWEDITMGSMIKWIQTPKSCRECECWDKR